MTAPVGRLTRRPEFLRVAERGRRAASPGMVVQAWRRVDEADGAHAAIRLGLTASRKVGGAVERNRARRRLRALARQVLARHGAAGHDYVLVARRETATRPWPQLVEDLEMALRRLGHWRGEEASTR
ncbi:MAG: ribonuclease P protein component [Alphaproteobacteria bacterium]|nr:ribonuclease P protein component [Alphaproteobacteria bacterium]